MKYILLCVLLVSGCASLPESATDAIANASAGCVKSSGIWGNITVMVGSTDKGVIRNGQVVVASDCGGITIQDAATVRVPAIAPIK